MCKARGLCANSVRWEFCDMMGIPSVWRYVSINDSKDMIRNIIYNLVIKVHLEGFVPIHLASLDLQVQELSFSPAKRILVLENRNLGWLLLSFEVISYLVDTRIVQY